MSKGKVAIMEFPEDVSTETKALWNALIELHKTCRNHTKEKYNRLNPFYEDLFDWSERGSFWTGENKGVTIYNSATIIGDVSIGANTWVGPFSLLDGGGGLEIGRCCSISTGCQLLTHDTAKWALSGGKMSYEYARTKIDDCCFLGSQVVVTKGITIGKHCLIAAGSVVTKNIADFTIAGGVPARTIGRVDIDSKGTIHLVYKKSQKTPNDNRHGLPIDNKHS